MTVQVEAANKSVKVAGPVRRVYPAVALLTALLLFVVVVASGVGAVRISFADVVRAILHPASNDESTLILFSLRLPRVLGAGIVGATLSATGVLFQGLFRNPLADPFVLGASGGAALGGAIAIFFIPAMSVAGISATAICAFAGAMLTMGAVWNMARNGGKVAVENTLLAGFAIGTMLNAATSALELHQESTPQGARMLAAWIRGGIGVPPWDQVVLTSIASAIAIVLAIPLARRLNTLALGEEYAEQLGVPVQRVQFLVVVLGSVLTALAVSLGGLVGFVGLLVPHFFRLIVGPDHVRLLPVATLGGAIFVIVADTVARTAFAPVEIPVGLLTAFLGGPAFLYLLVKSRKERAR